MRRGISTRIVVEWYSTTPSTVSYPLVRMTQDIIRQADEVNRIPLPPIPDKFGVRLPPLQYQTTLPNLQWDAEAEALPDQDINQVSLPARGVVKMVSILVFFHPCWAFRRKKVAEKLYGDYSIVHTKQHGLLGWGTSKVSIRGARSCTTRSGH